MNKKVGFSPIEEKFPGEAAVRERLSKDFEYYSGQLLKIAPKDGGIKTFKMNKAQKFIHEALNKQLKEQKHVRALILKGRQMGCSTYVAARYYWKVTKRHGVNAYILSHAKDTTEKLFAMSSRYHKYMDDIFKQSTRTVSKRELSFGDLDSSYYVGTAGSQETGRGGTVHYFHGSEVGFWANANTHFAGVIQSVPSGIYAENTEIILESTANGVGGKFHELWQEAEKGVGEYQAIFTPWYWQHEYQQTPPPGWDIDSSENEELRDQMDVFDLTVDQVYWAHTKRVQLGSDALFKQEYPATSQEAFQNTGAESFIPSPLVFEAMVPKGDMEAVGPVIAACDPARFGKDPTGIGHRQGRKFVNIDYHQNYDTMEVAGLCKIYMDTWKVDVMFIDVNGIGSGVYDKLKEDGFGHMIRAVNYGEAAMERDVYMNKRAECGGLMRKWLEDKPCEVPQMDSVRVDLLAPGKRYDSKGRIKVESKEDMGKRGVKSPTAWDVLSMTFAEPVHSRLKNIQSSVKVLSEYDVFSH